MSFIGICIELAFKELTSNMESKKNKIFCIGDSITIGYGIDDWNDIYPKRLNHLLGSQYDVNPYLGKCGAAVWRHSPLPYVSTAQYNNAISSRTDYLVVCLGSNDTINLITDTFRREFKEDYASLLDGLKKKSFDVKTYICRIPPIFGEENEPFAIVVPEINKLIEEVADSSGANLIDLNTPLLQREDLFSDGIHPNREGAFFIAKIVCDTLKINV